MTPYQDALIGRGLRPFPDPEDMMDPMKDVLMGYSAALAVECLEEVGNLEDKVDMEAGSSKDTKNEVSATFVA